MDGIPGPFVYPMLYKSIADESGGFIKLQPVTYNGIVSGSIVTVRVLG